MLRYIPSSVSFRKKAVSECTEEVMTSHIQYVNEVTKTNNANTFSSVKKKKQFSTLPNVNANSTLFPFNFPWEEEPHLYNTAESVTVCGKVWGFFPPPKKFFTF